MAWPFSATTPEPTAEEPSVEQTTEATLVTESPGRGLSITSLLDGLPAPTLLTDEHGSVTHANERLLALLARPATEVVGSSPTDLFGTETTLAAEVVATGQPILDHEERITVDAESIPVRRSVTPLTEGSEVVGTMHAVRDQRGSVDQAERADALETYQRSVVTDLQSKLERLAEGDLTVEPTIPAPDAEFAEIRAVHDEFEQLSATLSLAVGTIQTVIDHLTDQSDDLTESAGSLSATTEEVTASVQQIDASTIEVASGAERLAEETDHAAGSVDDLSASIEEITASIQQIDAQSSDAKSLARDGHSEVGNAVDQIRSATEAGADAAAEISSLEARMERVGEIVEMIADIADQTNMLALNANIEAARAGEAGSGFAVVANEVKSLAEESQDSADDIASIIEELQTQTDDVVDSIQQANSEVEAGADAVETVGDRLDGITSRIEQTSDGVSEISSAVEQQATNAETVSATIDDTSALTEQVTASIQQIAGGLDEQTRAMENVARESDGLNQMSDDVFELVDGFRVDADERASLDDDVVEDIDA